MTISTTRTGFRPLFNWTDYNQLCCKCNTNKSVKYILDNGDHICNMCVLEISKYGDCDICGEYSTELNSGICQKHTCKFKFGDY